MEQKELLISWGDLTEERKSFVEAYMLCFKGKRLPEIFGFRWSLFF